MDLILVIVLAALMLGLIGIVVVALTGKSGQAATSPALSAGAHTDLPSLDNRKTDQHQAEKQGNGAGLHNRLVQAGLYRRNAKVFFYMIRFLLAAAPIILGFMFYAMGLLYLWMAFLLSTGTAIAGIVAPGLWLDYRKAERRTKMRRVFPDALDVMIVCVEAGLSLNEAIIRVAKELGPAHPMLAEELTIVYREVQMGKSTGQGLRDMADRFDMEEVRSLSAVIEQSHRFGASIASALRVHGEDLREKRMQAAQVRAQKAAVKLLFPTIICIFPAILVVVLGPAVYDMIETFRNLSIR